MMTMEKLRNYVEEYLYELSWQHPFVNSDKFVKNSYSKWACKEILREIDSSENLPFKVTPVELLDQFSEKMKEYAYMNSKNGQGFVIAQETAEYLIEQCWIGEWKSNQRR